MKKVFNSLEEMNKYYDEGKNTYVFKEGGEYIEEIIFTFDIKVNANIDALNIKAFNLETMNINALNIEAHNITAKDIYANNIKAYDNESGLYGYAEIDKPDINCPSDIESYTKSKKIVLKNNGKRKICLIDNVGNKNEKTITVDHIDNTPMNCNFSVDGTIGGKDNNNLQPCYHLQKL